MNAGIPYVAGDSEFMYPGAGDEPAPPNTKCLILTKGGVCNPGIWGEDSLGWARLPKRNRKKEEVINAHKAAAR